MTLTPRPSGSRRPLAGAVLGLAIVVGGTADGVAGRAQSPWRPADGPLMTRWAADVTADHALPEYPRPQLVRADWLNLNGVWDYAIRPRDEARPASFDGRILVPFPVESALSGVMKTVGETSRLWYRRTFEVPASWSGRRTRLQFGAVDWDATVLVNGHEVGTHRGGYDAFTIDVTDALTTAGPQELVVSVWDPTDAGPQPRGKQVSRPRGIWYTSVTGIWQTVWIEPVADSAIDRLSLVPDVDAGVLAVTAALTPAAAGGTVTAVALDEGREIGRATGRPGEPLRVPVPDARLWSPDSPALYDLRVTLARGDTPLDTVSSYFAMRKSSLCPDEAGTPRLCLNDAPLFQVGPLDQGWWPDGLYTAPTDDALRSDIEVTKRLGFNLARKHVKVEPDRWYYWADRLGLLVWQDMPSTTIRGERPPESATGFEAELKALIDERGNHPSIVMWVPFNEGWGQYDTPRITRWVESYDPSRVVDNASGWTDAPGEGAVIDIHRYPGPGAPPREPTRAGVLGEFGGLGLPVAGHTWQAQANWSYRGFTTREALTDAYVDLIGRLHPLLGTPGLSAAVYTQTTDVEIEVNGLMTYDRAVIKPDEARIRAANRSLFTPPPVMTTIAGTARDEVVDWRYTTTAPAATWMAADFDDRGWTTGTGGFGTSRTPGAAVGTTWETPDIWIRRSFEVPAGAAPVSPHLFLHHDEDAEVFINGVLAARVTGYTADYELTPLTPEGRAALRPGRNTLAIHCHQTTGGQFIDAGLVDLVPAATGRQAMDESGFVPLFNGRDLDDWTLVGGVGPGYVVLNGTIVCPVDGGGNLFTTREYSDFVLRFEFRTEPGGNNGVGIRAPFEGDAAYVGMEIQILDDQHERYKGKIRSEQHHGSIYDVIPARTGFLNPAGEWNTEELVADGRHIRVTLNGVIITDADLDTVREPAVLAKHPGLARTTGHIGFLGHGTRVEFRNVRVRTIR
jgi:3-keto-disaccharide hydrolase/Glycosyl hydrolases family 2, sugar binding domain/Glycosyl hydrolases family 2/Glycosyl hydrolases family 2, TIM barrel domain